MTMHPIEGPNIPHSTLPFSPGIAAGPFVFVSGQASVDASGAIILGTFEDEMRRSIDNVRQVLEAAGMSLKDVVRVGAYLSNESDFPEYNRIYREYFAPPYPARTSVIVGLGPLKFEIDVIAYRDNR